MQPHLQGQVTFFAGNGRGANDTPTLSVLNHLNPSILVAEESSSGVGGHNSVPFLRWDCAGLGTITPKKKTFITLGEGHPGLSGNPGIRYHLNF